MFKKNKKTSTFPLFFCVCNNANFTEIFPNKKIILNNDVEKKILKKNFNPY